MLKYELTIRTTKDQRISARPIESSATFTHNTDALFVGPLCCQELTYVCAFTARYACHFGGEPDSRQWYLSPTFALEKLFVLQCSENDDNIKFRN